MGGEQDKQ